MSRKAQNMQKICRNQKNIKKHLQKCVARRKNMGIYVILKKTHQKWLKYTIILKISFSNFVLRQNKKNVDLKNGFSSQAWLNTYKYVAINSVKCHPHYCHHKYSVPIIFAPINHVLIVLSIFVVPQMACFHVWFVRDFMIFFCTQDWASESESSE